MIASKSRASSAAPASLPILYLVATSLAEAALTATLLASGSRRSPTGQTRSERATRRA